LFVQVRWLMGAPAGLKLHAELSALLGGGMLAGLHWAASLAARLAPLLPWLIGERRACSLMESRPNLQRVPALLRGFCCRGSHLFVTL
jgi:N-acetylglucosaminyl transferase component (Gpi1)